MKPITVCTPPSPDRGADSTQYLPIVEDGRVDTTIYQVDAQLDELNKATFAFEPESIRSMHEGMDEGGCTEVVQAPSLDISALDTFITAVSDAVKESEASFVGASGEQMIARAYDMRYGASGTSLSEMAQALTACTLWSKVCLPRRTTTPKPRTPNCAPPSPSAVPYWRLLLRQPLMTVGTLEQSVWRAQPAPSPLSVCPSALLSRVPGSSTSSRGRMSPSLKRHARTLWTR